VEPALSLVFTMEKLVLVWAMQVAVKATAHTKAARTLLLYGTGNS
jgi:hypothetical protein